MDGDRQVIAFAKESVVDLWDEVMPLLHSHWLEICTYKDIRLNPDKAVYARNEANGLFKAYTIRSDGALIGYAGYMVCPNMHYQPILMAVQDVLYLSPDYRGKLIGLRFIKWCDKQLYELGVAYVSQHVKTAHNWGPLLERIGYSHTENIYTRRL